MGISTGPGYCPACRRQVAVVCTAGAGWLHLALTLLTVGLWSIVWFYTRLRVPACICCRCGRKLARTCRTAHTQPLPAVPWPLDLATHNNSEFNSILVARNLVYYVPTSARYRRT